MQKTKLGLTVTFVAACMYFCGLFSTVPAALLVGYVLLKEDDEWLKKMAVKTVVLVLVFWVAGMFMNIIDELFAVINVIIGWVGMNRVSVPLNLTNLVQYVLYIVKALAFIVLGLQALKHESMGLGPIDGMVDGAMGVAKAVAAKPAAAKIEEKAPEAENKN